MTKSVQAKVTRKRAKTVHERAERGPKTAQTGFGTGPKMSVIMTGPVQTQLMEKPPRNGRKRATDGPKRATDRPKRAGAPAPAAPPHGPRGTYPWRPQVMSPRFGPSRK